MPCKYCQRPLPSNWGRGRRREFCDAACRMADMRRRKAAAGLIPRAPWKEDAREQYYARQELKNKYSNPNRGAEITFADYMQQYRPKEWALRSELRNAGPEKRNARRRPQNTTP